MNKVLLLEMGLVVLKSRKAVDTVASVTPTKLSAQSVMGPFSKLTKEETPEFEF